MSSRYNFCSVRTSFYAYLRNNELPLMDKLRACALQSIPGLFSKGLGNQPYLKLIRKTSSRRMASPKNDALENEKTPLLRSESPRRKIQKKQECKNNDTSCCIKFFNLVFYGLCAFTGQLFIDWNSQCKKKEPDGKRRL